MEIGSGSFRLLVVEDNPGDVDLIREHLADAPDVDLAVDKVGTLGAALELVDAEAFDAVLVDLNLPDSSGLATLDAVLDASGDLPVIVLTGMAGEELGLEAVRRGAADFLPKEELTGRLLLRSLRFAHERRRRRRTETRFRSFIENSRDLVAVLDGDFSVRYVSPSVSRILGFEPEEKTGEGALDEIHPDDRDRVAREGRRVLEDPSHTPRLQYRVRHRDGSWRVLDTVAQNCVDEPGPGALALNSWDITELRQAQDELRRSRNLLHQLVEGVPDAMYVKDRSGRYMLINEGGAELIGQTPDQVVGRTDRELFEPESAEEIRRNDRRVMEEGETFNYEEEITDVHGTTRKYLVTKGPIRDPQGRVTGLFGISRDVTELKRAQSDLQERMKELRALYAASRELTRNDVSLERKLEKVVELVPGGWLYPRVTEARLTYGDRVFRTAGFRETPWTLSEEIVSRNEVVGRLEVALTEERPERDHGPFLEEERELLGGLALAVSEAVERERLEREFIQAQKMEAVGRLSGGVAHDFNNLLTVIRAHTDFLLMDLAASGPLADEARAIQQAANRAAELTNQLLAFSREQVLRPRVLDLNDVVGPVERLAARVLGEDVRVETDLADDLPAVEVDPAQLEQALLNLAVNARDAMPEGGTLTLATRPEEVGPGEAAARPNLEEGSYVRLTVSDTGVGMDEETRARAFEPFFSTKGREEGTGLGLAMVYGIVTQSGGAIEVESAPGEGATFVLRFPAVEDAPEEIDRDVLPAALGSDVTGRVLVIEDDASVRRVTEAILRRADFEVEALADAESALEVLDEREGEFDLVLTDLVLPGMSGRELIDRLRERSRNVRLVAMSGYSETSPGRRGDLASEVFFIQKPFSPDALLEVVREAMAIQAA